VTPEQEQREDGDDSRNLPSRMFQEDVEAEDVDNHRAEQGEAERNETANQENQSAGDLAEADDIHVMAFHERFAEIGRERWRLWRHRDEVQKDVRAEDNEHQSEQDTGNDGGDFHAVMLNRMGRISTLFQVWLHRSLILFLASRHALDVAVGNPVGIPDLSAGRRDRSIARVDGLPLATT
jgi:hypothetical protein